MNVWFLLPIYRVIFQGFEDCLVFDELMDQFHNDLGE